VRDKKEEQERGGMPKSSEVRKESSKKEREEGRTSEEGKHPLRKVPEREDPQVEAKKKIKASKWISK
jgi:hypothetical protein